MNQIDEENTVLGVLVSIPAVLDNGAAVALKEEDISFTQDELDVPKEQPLFRKNPNALKKNVRFDTQTYSTTAIEVINDSIIEYEFHSVGANQTGACQLVHLTSRSFSCSRLKARNPRPKVNISMPWTL